MDWRSMQFPASRLFSRGSVVIGLAVIVLIIYAGYVTIDHSEKDTIEPTSKSDDGSLVVRGVLSLVLIVGLIAALAVAMRRMNFRTGRGKAAEQVQIISSVFIGSKKQIVLMRVMNRVLVLGVTDAAINKLAEFPNPSPDENGAKEAMKPEADFMSMLEGWRK